MPNESTRICSAHFIDNWHSDDPEDVNYVPTIFSYKEKEPTPSQKSRRERTKARSVLKVWTQKTTHKFDKKILKYF